MTLFLRSVGIAITCLVTGYLVGWLGRPSPAPSIAKASHEQAATSTIPSVISNASAPETRVAPISVQSAIGIRRETARWLATSGVMTELSISVIDTERFNLSLALALGLTPAELEQLDGAIKQTKKSIDELKLHAAKGQVSEDGKTLIVTIPSISAESGVLYASLLNTIKQVLGPDRYSFFNEVAGPALDRSFGQFGLNPVTYELTLQPISTMEGQPPSYALKDSYIDVSQPGSGGWGTNQCTLDRLPPVVARFLPADLKK